MMKYKDMHTESLLDMLEYYVEQVYRMIREGEDKYHTGTADDDDLEHALGQVKEIRSELRYRCGQ